MTLPAGYTLRPVTPDDARLLADQREAMFADMGRTYQEAEARFAHWVQPRIESGSYLGWLAGWEDAAVAGVGLVLQDWPPGSLNPQPLRGYLDNVYTQPQHRGRGLAAALIGRAVEETRSRGIRILSLYASEAGRPLYERLGFQTGPEMHLVLDRTPDGEVPA